MNLALIVSIGLRVVAFVLSIVLLRRVRDWRLGLFPLLFGLMALQQTFRLLEVGSEVPGLIVSVLATLAMMAMVRLMREQKKADEALRVSEERLRLAFEAARMGTFDWDVVQNKIVWSRGHEALFGFAPGEFGGTYEAFEQRVHSEDLPGVNEEVARCIAARTPFAREFRVVWPDGSVHWVAGLGEVEFSDAGHAVRMRGVVQEVTARKQAEEALRQSERWLRDVIDNLGPQMFVGLMTLDGTLIEANKPALAAAGLKPEEVLGKPFDQTYWWSYSGRVQQQLRHAIERATRGEASRYDVQVRVEENQFIIIDFSLQPMRDETGKVVFLVPSANVITERKRAEEERARLLGQVQTQAAQLERRVAERTAELLERNAELDAFSHSVSHDLRAPLRAVSGFAEILARRHRAALNEEGRRYVDNIVEASARMDQLIDDLLMYARLGRMAVRREPVRLGDVLASIGGDLAPRVAELGARLEIPDDLPLVRGDPTLLRQIFTNLLDNALTYRRPGVPHRVEVQCETNSDHIIIRVVDNGIGIPPEYCEKIFHLFQRLHSAEAYPGTGVGLATVKKSAELMGGQVWVESKVGEGSVFYVRLPGGAQ